MTDPEKIDLPPLKMRPFRPDASHFRSFLADWSRWRQKKHLAQGMMMATGALTLGGLVALSWTPILVGLLTTGISSINVWGTSRQQRRYEKALSDELAHTTKDEPDSDKSPAKKWTKAQVEQALFQIKTQGRALRFSSRVSGYILGLPRKEVEKTLTMVDSIVPHLRSKIKEESSANAQSVSLDPPTESASTVAAQTPKSDAPPIAAPDRNMPPDADLADQPQDEAKPTKPRSRSV